MAKSRQKEVRCKAILDSAEALIRSHCETNFSMLMLAERAGVSPATPYNLFGTKDSILYALLQRSLDSIHLNFHLQKIPATLCPVEVVVLAAEKAADFFIADPDYYRVLQSYLIGVKNEEYRSIYLERAFSYWLNALEQLVVSGAVSRGAQQEMLARQFMMTMLGALQLWTQYDIDNSAFRAHVIYGVSSLLFPVADLFGKSQLQHHLTSIESNSSIGFSFMTRQQMGSGLAGAAHPPS